MRTRRPFSVTLLALGVLSIAVINTIRFVQALQLWEFLYSLPGVSPPYLAITGAAWALVNFPLWWGLWTGQRWAPHATLIGLAAYVLYAWFDRIFVANTPLTLDGSHAWPFRVGATLVILVLVIWILSRQKAKTFFRRNV